MRILIDGHLAGPNIDGVGRYIIELVRALSSHRELEIILITSSTLQKDRVWSPVEFKGLSTELVKYSNPSPIKQQLLINKLIRKYSPDVYHHPQFDLPFNLSIPTIATIHDLKYLINASFFKKGKQLKQIAQRFFMMHTLRKADRIIAVSENTKNDIIDLLGINDGRISVVYHGIGGGYSRSTSTGNIVDDKRLNILNNEKFIFFIGSRRPHKNILKAINGFKIAKNTGKISGMKFIIAGKPYAGYKAPEEFVDRFNLEKDVFFWDNVTDAELNMLYKHAQCMMFPSLYEGFGLPVLEAMQMGTPVITSNISSLPEVAGDAALIIDPYNENAIAESLVKIVTNKELVKDMITKGYVQSSKFTWEKCAEQTIKVYESLLQ